MFNSKKPIESELPTAKQLFKSTLFALLVAVVVLVVIVLPAEYAIDVTGLGKVLGLTEMGDIKTSLVEENEQAVEKKESVVELDNNTEIKTKNLVFDLEAGSSIEYKLEMTEGAEVTYWWGVENGSLAYDMHGEGYKGSKDFISYKKGKDSKQDEGLLQAAFIGNHGWYWKNKGSLPVKVTLYVKGRFKKLKRVM